jgi:hypothetical protein
MALRSRLASTADRLIAKFGDEQQFITIFVTPGVDEFDPPTLAETEITVNAVVTGVGKWEQSETILSSDLRVLVGGGAPIADVGGVIKIDDKNHTIIERQKILASGQASAVKYFVRRG